MEEESDTPRASWLATAGVLAAYFAFILTIAFAPDLFARPAIGGGLTSLGLMIGIGLIVGCIVLGLLYTAVRNRR